MNKNIQALAAIARKKTVTVGDSPVTVGGLGLLKIAELAVSYPAAAALIAKKTTNIQSLIQDVPGFIIDAIHCALGDDTDDGREVVANLSPDDLLTISEAVLEATLPDGLESFMKRLEAVMTKFAPSLEVETAKAQAAAA